MPKARMPLPTLRSLRRFTWRIGRKLYMSARKDVPNHMLTNGEFWLQQRVVSLARSGSNRLVVMDVGANIGAWISNLLSLAQHPPALQCVAHAFEPFPGTFAKLQSNLAAEANRGQVHLHQLALSSSSGTAMMRGQTQSGVSSICAPSHPGGEEVVVRTSTIDDFCRQHLIHEVHLLKSDTEGHDFDVILGAQQMLRSGSIHLFQFEYNHRWIPARRYLKDVFDLVASADYKVAKLVPARLEVYDAWHPELERFFEANYVLARSDLLDSVGTRFLTFGPGNTFA